MPKVYQLLLKILQKKQVVYYNRYISIQNNESEDLIMSERKDPPEFTPKTCPVCGGRAMNAFKDRENFTSFEMVCWDSVNTTSIKWLTIKRALSKWTNFNWNKTAAVLQPLFCFYKADDNTNLFLSYKTYRKKFATLSDKVKIICKPLHQIYRNL